MLKTRIFRTKEAEVKVHILQLFIPKILTVYIHQYSLN